MKKFLILSIAALMVTGVTFADNGKKKKCAKGKKCCKAQTKSCCMKKSTTASM
jgi:hypothetical protein